MKQIACANRVLIILLLAVFAASGVTAMEYTVKLENIPFSAEDSASTMKIFLTYLNEKSWRKDFTDASDLIIIQNNNNGGAWWNPIYDNRKSYRFIIKRHSDGFFSTVVFYSSTYDKDEIYFTDEDFESVKKMVYKYLYPLENTKDEDILLSYAGDFLLTPEESNIVREAFQNAWFDGDPYHMSGAEWTVYEGAVYSFRYKSANRFEVLFLYSQSGKAIPSPDYYSGKYLYFLKQHEEQIEAIIKKYVGDDAFRKLYGRF